MKRVLLLACTLLAGAAGRPLLDPAPGDAPLHARADQPTGVLFKSITIAGDDHLYGVYVPRDYDPARAWPCIVFLNGSGECGRDGQKQLGVGLLPAVMLKQKEWPAIIVFPQKPDSESEWEDHEALVLGALDAARKEWNIDPARIALTGLSQGGHGTWVIGSRHPDLFSRLAPICGYGTPGDIAPGATKVPVRAFHGERDETVKPKQTRAIVDAIKALAPDADVKATFYPEANHNSWDRAYRDENLGWWLTRPRD